MTDQPTPAPQYQDLLEFARLFDATFSEYGFGESAPTTQETTMDETKSNAIPAIVEAHRSGWRPQPTALDMIGHIQQQLTTNIRAQDLWSYALSLECALGTVDDDREIDLANEGVLPLVRDDIPGGYAEKTPMQVLCLLAHLDTLARNPELAVKLLQRLNARMHAFFLP